MKIKTGQGKITLHKLIAIYSISMITSLPGLAISPILGKLESIFRTSSELQLQMLEALPSFIIVPFILLAGRLSLQVNKKQLLILGLAIFFACSIIYPFAGTLPGLLWISAAMGIGAGLVIPFSTGLVADYFSGNYRTRQLGYVSAITNLTLVLATLLAGFLAGINWHLPFTVYCLSGISLFFAFFLDKKPPYYSASAREKKIPGTSRQKDTFRWPVSLMLLYYLITLLALTIPLNLAFYMRNLHIGNYNTSGTLIAVFFLSITLPGLFISRLIAVFKSYINFIAMVMMSVGLIFFMIQSGMVLLTLGVILIGFGYGMMQPIIYDKTAAGVTPSHATYALSLVMVMNYIAIITYPFILRGIKELFSDFSAVLPFTFSAVVSLAFTVFVFIRHRSRALN